MAPEITIRQAVSDDRSALERLAGLDSALGLAGDALIAEERGLLRAAIELDSGRVIADPFAPTAALVELLRLQRARLSAIAA